MFYYIYRIPMNILPLVIVVMVIIWAAIMRFMPQKYDKAARIFSRIMLLISILGIVYVTLFREGTHNREVYLMPFHIFSEAAGETDFYRSMLMNIFLFVPFGLFTPFSVSDRLKTGKKILLTVSAAVILSVIVEIMQYIFFKGRCETDDVLCNALGALIGSASYILYKIKGKTSNE